MNVIFVSSEVYPFSKTGGLADVSESLPVALKKKGVNILVVTPLYASINREKFNICNTEISFKVFIDFHWEYITVFKAIHKNLTIYFLENINYFNVDDFYGGNKSDIRFGLFSYASLELSKKLNFKPDIFHLNDWQSSLISVLLQTNYKNDYFFRDTKTLLTIHNLAYQGFYPEESLYRLSLPREVYHLEGIEFYNQINFLKGGIVFSDYINTVSPEYAKEILTYEAGRGLHGVLRKRKDRLFGILNGIDYDEWNPETDIMIPVNYSSNEPDKKTENKLALQKRLNFELNEKIPMFAFVGRLIEQKGISLIIDSLEELMNLKINIVILGTGDDFYMEKLLNIAEKYQSKISVNFTFDESFSRKIYAGSDFFFMPSLYEPCGIAQMISMRYGTIPIVRKVGGLKDSVKDGKTGFLFSEFKRDAFLKATLNALKCYANKSQFSFLKRCCMEEDFSWETSSELYIKLYKKIKEE